MTTMIQLNVMMEEGITVLHFPIPDDVPEPLHNLFGAGALAGVIAYIQQVQNDGKTILNHKHSMSIIRVSGITTADLLWICKYDHCEFSVEAAKTDFYGMMRQS